MRLVAVTACLVGVAHTYMAARALQKAAERSGAKLRVETQGALGCREALSPEEVAAAQAVVLAVDIKVSGFERFAGKAMIIVSPAEAIRNPDSVIAQAMAKASENGGV